MVQIMTTTDMLEEALRGAIRTQKGACAAVRLGFSQSHTSTQRT